MVGRFGFLRRTTLLSVLACLAAVGLALPSVGSADNSQGQNNHNQRQNGNGLGRATAVTCGDTISTPGRYFLAANCSGGLGIEIDASDVTLRLRGHTMTGPGFGIGVLADDEAGPVFGLKILGPGTIRNYGYGVSLGLGSFGVSGSVVRGLTADNGSVGIRLVFSDDSKVQRNTADNNFDGIEVFDGTGNKINANTTNNNKAGYGIFLFHSTTGNTVNGNTADNNKTGIALQPRSTGNRINGNTALGNSSFDLFDGNPDCDSNKWRGNDFGSADPMSCIH